MIVEETADMTETVEIVTGDTTGVEIVTGDITGMVIATGATGTLAEIGMSLSYYVCTSDHYFTVYYTLYVHTNYNTLLYTTITSILYYTTVTPDRDHAPLLVQAAIK